MIADSALEGSQGREGRSSIWPFRQLARRARRCRRLTPQICRVALRRGFRNLCARLPPIPAEKGDTGMGGKDAPRRDAGFMRTRPASRIARTPRAIRSARHRYTAGPAARLLFSANLLCFRASVRVRRMRRTDAKREGVCACKLYRPEREEELLRRVGSPSNGRAYQHP